ncbi:MAG: hypothetical protein IAF58_19185 [Leptolyngbya sp.]|nr:hypothetical protein [Candidatus Melainabacteria bacterium]
MVTKLQRFETLVLEGNLEGLKDFLRNESPQDLHNYSAKSLSIYKRIHRTVPWNDGRIYKFLPNEFFPEETSFACNTALVATTASDKLANTLRSTFDIAAFDYEFIESLKPAALQSFGSAILEGGRYGYLDLVRKMMKSELCAKPKTDDYIYAWISRSGLERNMSDELLKTWIDANGDFLAEDIWRFFELEGTAESSLTSYDRGNQFWSDLFVEFCHRGLLPRQRVLKSSLEALNRGFSKYHSEWFSRLHEKLSPTAEERMTLLNEYYSLLSSSVASTVILSLNSLSIIAEQKLLEEEKFLRSVAPVFFNRDKKTIQLAMKLFTKISATNLEFAKKASFLAIDGLQHEATDLQEQILSFIQKFGKPNDEALSAKLDTYKAYLSPLVSNKFAEILGHGNKPEVVHTEGEKAYVYAQQPSPAWPLGHKSQIIPISSIEEFSAKALYCMEHPESILEFERVIDALATLPDLSTVDFASKCKPIHARAKKILKSNSVNLSSILSFFLLHWIESTEVVLVESKDSMDIYSGLTILKLANVLRLIQRQVYLRPLSSACFEGGWIDAESFLERYRHWQQAGEVISGSDFAIAMARIPPDERSKIIDSSKLTEVHHRLFERSLHSFADSPETLVDACAQTLSSPSDKRAVWNMRNFFSPRAPESLDMVRLAAWTFPTLRECIHSFGIDDSINVIRETDPRFRLLYTYFEMLVESGAPLEKSALDLMLIGLLASEPELTSYSKDALILAIQENRFNPLHLGSILRNFLHGNRAKPKRLAASLKEVSRVSYQHTDAVIQLLGNAFFGENDYLNREISAVLELLLELLTESKRKFDFPEARKYLAEIPLTGKTAKLSKQILKDF